MDAVKVLLFVALFLCWTSQVLSQSDGNDTHCNSTGELNVTALRDELERDEGYRTDIYPDPVKGYLTVGIGHRILPSDPEYGKPVGTKVTDERVEELFTQDVSIALENSNAIFSNFDTLPQEAQRVIANMMFNLGKKGFKSFKKLIAAVKDCDWSKAADEMKNSTWHGQVGDRAPRLVERMRNLAE